MIALSLRSIRRASLVATSILAMGLAPTAVASPGVVGPPYESPSTDTTCYPTEASCVSEVSASIDGDLLLRVEAISPLGGMAPGVGRASGGAGVDALYRLDDAVSIVSIVVKLHIFDCAVTATGDTLAAARGGVDSFTLISHSNCETCVPTGTDRTICTQGAPTQGQDVELLLGMEGPDGIPAGVLTIDSAIVGFADLTSRGRPLGTGRVRTQAQAALTSVRVEGR